MICPIDRCDRESLWPLSPMCEKHREASIQIMHGAIKGCLLYKITNLTFSDVPNPTYKHTALKVCPTCKKTWLYIEGKTIRVWRNRNEIVFYNPTAHSRLCGRCWLKSEFLVDNLRAKL